MKYSEIILVFYSKKYCQKENMQYERLKQSEVDMKRKKIKINYMVINKKA